MITKIKGFTAWLLGVLILVGLPVLLDEQGVALAGVFILGYAGLRVWKARAGT